MYCEDMYSLFTRPDPSMAEDKKLGHLMRGVKQELFAGLVRHPPHTVAEFVAEATPMERTLEERARQGECIDDLQEQVNGLIRKIDDLENRSQRNNIIIFGVKEPEGEPQQSLEEQVTKHIFEDLLKISDVAIERIHRTGRPAENKCRPVILKLVDGRDKVKIFKNCCNLKGTEYSISEDFSPRVQAIRKKLWASAKAERDSGVKVDLLFDKIKINGKLHQWDDLLNKRVPLSAP
ncbi:uncharacterized protein LOC144149458 [Haemaphysalis longicornis]